MVLIEDAPVVNNDDPSFRADERVIVMLDVVESVRLTERDESGFVRRWIALMHDIEAVAAEREGRVRKRMGDGLILEFHAVPDAMTAAFAIHALAEAVNCAATVGTHLLLRIAIDICPVIDIDNDLYGQGINLLARVLTLAGPGETVVTARARDHLTPTLDADVEDLGENYVKHIQKPVRIYRAGPPGPQSVLEPAIAPDDLTPVLAVLPFDGSSGPEGPALGQVIAEELITRFSRSADLRVISRLSANAVAGRGLAVDEIAARLHADYLLAGTFRWEGDRLTLDAELSEPERGAVVWSQRVRGTSADLLDGEQGRLAGIVAEVSGVILARELRLVRSHPLPTLKHYTLMLGAIALMYRLSAVDFHEAKRILETLLSRAPRQPLPQAWLANWHVLKVQQGWSADPDRDGQLAVQATRRALDVDPENSLALAIDGFVNTNLMKRLDVAEQRYGQAIDANPSNGLAWLLRGTMHAFRGEGTLAVPEVERALTLSPLDPHRFFYDSLAATAHVAAENYGRAIVLAKRSLRANRTHTSTLRVLAVAQWGAGLASEARATAAELMRVEPSLTVESWLRRSPSAAFPIGRRWAQMLKDVGVPS